ncbi:MAG: insulinase family protein [Cellvibrionales bacterium]|nr:insulinase family protein [Cellvibrionales bacterium]
MIMTSPMTAMMRSLQVLLTAFCLLFVVMPVQATDQVLAVPVAAGVLDAPVQGETDKRDYRNLVLANGMKVLLVSDPHTDKSAAALDVATGSGDDPEQRQGLAHFLEHMLFLGTKKFPEPGEYQAFISDNGGSHNAFTSLEHTNYFFDIDPQQLKPALDRFSQFLLRHYLMMRMWTGKKMLCTPSIRHAFGTIAVAWLMCIVSCTTAIIPRRHSVSAILQHWQIHRALQCVMISWHSIASTILPTP